MSPLLSWLLVVGVSVLVSAAVMRLVGRWLSPPPPRVPPFEVFQSWPPQQRAAWMRHPGHAVRCACGEFGLPWPDMDAIGCEPDPVRHGSDRCQPAREAVA